MSSFYHAPVPCLPRSQAGLKMTDTKFLTGGLSIQGGNVASVASELTATAAQAAANEHRVNIIHVLGRFMGPLIMFILHLNHRIVGMGVHANCIPATRTEGDVLSTGNTFINKNVVRWTCAMMAMCDPRSWYFVTNDMTSPATMFLTVGNGPCVPSTLYINDIERGKFAAFMAAGAGFVLNTELNRKLIWSFISEVIAKMVLVESGLVDQGKHVMRVLLGYYMAALIKINVITTEGVVRYRHFSSHGLTIFDEDEDGSERALRMTILTRTFTGNSKDADLIQPSAVELLMFIREVDNYIFDHKISGYHNTAPKTGWFNQFMYECAVLVVSTFGGIPVTAVSQAPWRLPLSILESEFYKDGRYLVFRPTGGLFERMVKMNFILGLGLGNGTMYINKTAVRNRLAASSIWLLSNSTVKLVTSRMYNPFFAIDAMMASELLSVEYYMSFDTISEGLSSSRSKKYPQSADEASLLAAVTNIAAKLSLALSSRQG